MKKNVLFLLLAISLLISCRKKDVSEDQSGCRITEWKSYTQKGNSFEEGFVRKIFYNNEAKISKVETYMSGRLDYSVGYKYAKEKIVAYFDQDSLVWELYDNQFIRYLDGLGLGQDSFSYNLTGQLSNMAGRGSTNYYFNYDLRNLTEVNFKNSNRDINLGKCVYDEKSPYVPFSLFSLPFFNEFGIHYDDVFHVLYEQGYLGGKVKNAIKQFKNAEEVTYDLTYVLDKGKVVGYTVGDKKYEFKYSCN